MVFRFLISQNPKLLPHPEPVERNHFLSMSKFVSADDGCSLPQVPGDIQAWQRCTDQRWTVFAIQHISWCSKYLLSLILPGGKKSQVAAFWHLTCSCHTFSLFAQLTKHSV